MQLVIKREWRYLALAQRIFESNYPAAKMSGYFRWVELGKMDGMRPESSNAHQIGLRAEDGFSFHPSPLGR